VYTLGLFSRHYSTSPLGTRYKMSEISLVPNDVVLCAWCKDSKPVTETTWFMPEPGERSVRLCNFCYKEARKQVRLLRIVRNRGEFPIIEAAS
jgi:hypothetical protein